MISGDACSTCGQAASVYLTEIGDFQVRKIPFCPTCAAHHLIGNTAAFSPALPPMRPFADSAAQNLQGKIANAEFRLRAAIVAEAYEEAALWRDEIRRLAAIFPSR